MLKFAVPCPISHKMLKSWRMFTTRKAKRICHQLANETGIITVACAAADMIQADVRVMYVYVACLC
jgi:hypothetical protein